MTKLLARMVIVGAAQMLETEWRNVIKLRDKYTDEFYKDIDENNPEEASHRQARLQAIRDVETETYARIAAASKTIQGMEAAMQYLDDNG